ncbi:MAG TPA: hypothetical protein VMV75_08810 [Sulfuricella sp.]|nr:hypothetical protein [Sulfuricella sp.]
MMNINEIIQSQLNAAIAGLTRARDKIAGMKPDDTHEIGQQIESAAFYLEDIQYNWPALVRSHAVQHPPHQP